MLTPGQEFEYNIALKILNYDLSNIEKEIVFNENRTNNLRSDTRLNELYVLREKKINNINQLKKNIKNIVKN